MVKKTRESKSSFSISAAFILGAILIIILNKYYKASLGKASMIVGGLGLFIYGMRLMSDGLQEVAGERLRKVLKFLTGKRLAGVLTGIGITAIIQSSSATTVMVVGFVNSGLLALSQAAGVILGANVGTTITGQLIAFKLKVLALPAIAVGSAMFIFGKNEKIKLIGKISLGFGLLFFAMGLMSSPLNSLRNNADFRNLFVKFSDNPILGLLAGTFLTVIVQSSSVTVAITMNLAAAGLISFSAAIPIILGDNIGTTITALIASIGTSLSAKRAAIVHTLFNIFGAVLIMFLLSPYAAFIDRITPGGVPMKSSDIEAYAKYSYNGKVVQPLVRAGDKYVAFKESAHFDDKLFVLINGQYVMVAKTALKTSVPNMLRHVANAHSVFNILNLLVWLPMINILTWAAVKIYPGKDVEFEDVGPKFIDKRFLGSPPIAVKQIEAETLNMFNKTKEMFKIVREMTKDFSDKKMEVLLKKEKLVNLLENEISSYAYLLFDKNLAAEEKEIVNCCLNSIHEIERIGDHCISSAESLQYKAKNNVDFSEPADKELEALAGIVYKIIGHGIKHFEMGDKNLYSLIRDVENSIDKAQKKARKKHIKRMNEKKCKPSGGIVFVDLINDFERIGDHVQNIAIIAEENELSSETPDMKPFKK